MNYKLKLYTETEEGATSWLPLFINVDRIEAFYSPILDEDEIPSINIFIGSGFITVMQEAHIINYLNNRFSNNLIKE